MKKLVPALLLIFLCGITISPAEKSAEWKLAKSGDGIRAYSKIIEGSSIHEFKALTIVNARLEVVAQIIRDVPNYHQWMAFCKNGEIIKRFDENNMIVHILMDFPVVAGRDLVVKADTAYDLSKARGIVNLSLIKNSDVPVPKDVIRMSEFTGSYQFEFITREKTGVIFSYCANPGGKIPPFIINMFSERLLYDTLRNLKNRMVRIEQYTAAAEKSRDRALFEGILSSREKVRSIIKARMKEHYRDYRSIDKLLVHNEVVDKFLAGEASRLTEIVFNSLGSRAMLMEAAQGALELILMTAAKSDKYLYTIPREPGLINKLIDGTKAGEKCVYDVVLEKARDSLKDEFKK